MSLVKVQGNASGTGIFTIASPNSNTDRTINLPDSNGTILTTATPGVPVNGPAFSAYQSTAQTISNSTFTKISMPNELFDTASAFDSTTNFRFQPTVAGYYQLNGQFNTAGASVGYVQVAIYKNGFQYSTGSSIPNNTQVGGQCVTSSLVYLNGSTDYVELYGWQNSGASLGTLQLTGANSLNGFLARSAT
jgi:hypothetical protein